MSAPEAEIFETKLTRTEVLDLILDELVEELDGQIAPLRDAVAALPKEEAFDFIAIAPRDGKGLEVSLDDDCYGRRGETRVRLTFFVRTKNLPVGWLRRCTEEERLRARLQELESQRRRLTENRRRAQNEIIRRSLEASVDGRRVLETVGKFKLALKQKLLPSPAKEGT